MQYVLDIAVESFAIGVGGVNIHNRALVDKKVGGNSFFGEYLPSQIKLRLRSRVWIERKMKPGN